jgi:hypothetical protein
MPIIISRKAQRFAAKIMATTNLDLVRIECGLHSGIPKCCILFHIKAWWPMTFNKALMDAYGNIQKALAESLPPRRRPQHVLCPACLLARKVVRVKNCNCHRMRTICLEQKKSDTRPWRASGEWPSDLLP